MTAQKSTLEFNPFSGCQFQDKEAEIVETYEGFTTGDSVGIEGEPALGTVHKSLIVGKIIAIATNVIYTPGQVVPLFAVQVADGYYRKTSREILKFPG